MESTAPVLNVHNSAEPLTNGVSITRLSNSSTTGFKVGRVNVSSFTHASSAFLNYRAMPVSHIF